MMSMTKVPYSFFFFPLLIIVLSCQKQSPPAITPEEIKGIREIERLEACSKVNFNKGVFLYRNALDLFVCTKWDEEFPHMFKSLKTVNADSWNHIMEPIDQAFIENQVRRDHVFKNIHDLDSKGGLDDLSYVISALNEKNFFDSAKTLFTCTENPINYECLERAGRIPLKKSLKNIIHFVDVKPETFESFSFFIKALTKSLEGKQEVLRTEINKFRASPLYIPARLKIVDAIASKVNVGLSEEDRDFISKILLSRNSNEDTPWIYQWIQDSKMNREKFRDLLEYPVLTNPEFVGEIKKLEKIYDSALSCSIKSNNNPNDLVRFVFKAHLSDYVSVIRLKNYKDFYDFSSMGLVGLKSSTEVCRELESNKYDLNFIKTLTHFADFMKEKKYYELVKFLLTQTTASGDLDKTFAQNLYLPDMVTNEIFFSINKLNTDIISRTREFFPLVFDMVQRFTPEAFDALGTFAQDMTLPENDSKFKALAEVWDFFNTDEKNFAFNFLDRHFDKKTKFVLLFDFYTKFLDDLKDVQPIFKEKWIGNSEKEEASYSALQDLFFKLAGKDTLLDFKKFFSRNQILKVLEVISHGSDINKKAKNELNYIYSDVYIARSRSDKYILKINYNSSLDSDYDSSSVLECMQKFSDIQNGFYELVRHLPAACTSISNENIAFRMFGWLNAIEDSYLSYKKTNTSVESLLDQSGILSPYMINSSIAMTKILDGLIGPLGAPLPTEHGFNYLLNSVHDHLIKMSAAPLVDDNVKWISRIFDVSPERNILHRNALVKSFSEEDNFSYSKMFFYNIGNLFSEYGNWIKQGEHSRAVSRSFGKYDPMYDCEKVVNHFIAPYPCPGREVVKKYGNSLLYSLRNIFEKENGSPVAMLLKALKTNEGLSIPLNSMNSKKFRLSLKDTFRFLYDTSDKKLKINNQEISFVNEKNERSREKVTTLERIESVIREVRFGNNYLGAAYLNAVVHGENYNLDVLERKKLLQKCVNLPVIRCTRKMSDSDLRMALNSLEVYDALLDINNGRSIDARFNYGDYLKTFLQSLVASSATEAQKEQLLPLKDEALLKHNGKVLNDITLLTGLSNAARLIQDRIGRTRLDFERFISSEEFKRVDRSLLYGFDLPVAGMSAELLLNKLKIVPINEKQNLFENSVDWVAGLNYDEIRLVEDTIGRAMVVGSFLGSPEVVFSNEHFKSLTSKYSNNNVFQLFLALEKIIDYWPTLKNYFPIDVKLIEVVKPINTALYFLTKKLSAVSDPEKNIAYIALNDLFLILQKSVFDNIPNNHMIRSFAEKTQGLELLIEALKNPELVSNSYSLVNEDYRYLSILHLNNGDWFSTIGQNIKRMARSAQVDFVPIRDYLSFTTQNEIRRIGNTSTNANYHFDEPASLIKFLSKKANNDQTNFMLLNQKVFIENFDKITEMINYLIPAIAIKAINPPFRFN